MVKANNDTKTIKSTQLLLELIIDYLVIVVYLIGLAVVIGVIYFFIGRVPQYTVIQIQLFVTFTTVIPIIVIFTYMEYRFDQTFGKKVANIKLHYKNKTVWKALLRNIIKFLPWQLGHIGSLAGVYSEYESVWAIVLSYTSVIFLLILLGMRFFKKDRKHIGDMLAGTRLVEVKSDE